MSEKSNRKPCGCEATVNEDDPRAEIWMKVFGSRTFPLKHPVPVAMQTFPGKRFYMGDAKALSAEQKDRFFEAMMAKFKVTREEVEQSIIDNQIPILAENVIVKICNLHFRCML